MRNFAEVLLPSDTDATALVVCGRPVTYRDLRSKVERWATRLTESGLIPGDCVLIIDDNSLFYVAAYLSTIYAGGVAVPLSPSTSAKSLLAQVETSQARWGFVGRKDPGTPSRGLGQYRVEPCVGGRRTGAGGAANGMGKRRRPAGVRQRRLASSRVSFTR